MMPDNQQKPKTYEEYAYRNEWSAMRYEASLKREEKREVAKEVLEAFVKEHGIYMKALQPTQIRLEEGAIVLDIYPTNKKWHNVKQNKRGTYKDLLLFLHEVFIERKL